MKLSKTSKHLSIASIDHCGLVLQQFYSVKLVKIVANHQYRAAFIFGLISKCFFADGWTTADLIYVWKEIDPVQIVKDLNLPRFKLEQFQTTYCNTITNTGSKPFYRIS